jgi:hypothetical protein
MREEMTTRILSHPGLLVMLWLHTELDPPDHQWSLAVQALHRERRQRGRNPDQLRHIVISDGGAPGVAQRSQLFRDVHEGQPVRAAAVTLALSNPVKRCIATAISWLNPALRFFQPARFQDALAYLELGDYRREIEREYRDMNERFGRLVQVFERVSF